MELSFMALGIVLGAFVAFTGLAFLAAKRASTKDMGQSDASSDKPLKQCYECLQSSGLGKSSTAECASACGMPV